MAYSSEKSYIKNVTVPRYPAEIPYQGLPHHYQELESSINGTVFRDNNTSFLLNNHVLPQYDPVEAIRLKSQLQPQPQQQTFSDYRPWPSSSPSSIPLSSQSIQQNGSVSKNGVAVQSISAAPPLDYRFLLLSLAEDYFAAAHSQGSLAALVRRQVEMQNYYKLIATGLGCLEAVLKHFKLQPHLEAVVRLKYGTVLYEETENAMEAEEALSKGIIICERHKFFDTKYNMQYVLARVLFKQNPRASLKYLDGIIEDVEAYQHIAWVYAFRFLRVSVSFELSTHLDTPSALGHLRSITALSNRHGDRAIVAMASTLEAMTYLQQSNSNENIEHAQRALALARSEQLDPAVGSVPQLAILMQFVDVCSTLQKFDPTQAVPKMQALQTTLENIFEDQSWTEDGSFTVSVTHAGLPTMKPSSGVIQSLPNGTKSMVFNWLPKEDVYVLGCLLSGIIMAHRNTTDGQKAEQMFLEGLRTQNKNPKDMSTIPQSIQLASSRKVWRQLLRCYLQLHLTFALSSRTAWSEAENQLHQLQETAATLPSESADLLNLQILYLSGVIHQGTGDLITALSIFQSPSLALPSPDHTPSSPNHLDLSILSALNTLLIIRTPTHPSHYLLSPLLATLSPLCATNPNKPLLAAYHLLLATCSPSNTILRTKQHLQSALQAAKQSASNQLMCMTLNFMSWKFFKGVVGEQAQKSARASQNLAKKGMDRLWESVASGVLSDTLEIADRPEEAERVRRAGMEIASRLPEAMWRDREVEDVYRGERR